VRDEERRVEEQNTKGIEGQKNKNKNSWQD
jgi:hypothetical protein